MAAQAEAHRRELSGLQAALDTQVQQMEVGWRAQLSASQRALAEATNERMRMAADATVTSVQVCSRACRPWARPQGGHKTVPAPGAGAA